MISIIPFILKAHLGIDTVCWRWPFFHALAGFHAPLKRNWFPAKSIDQRIVR
jgi:hypothetical protein